jgi:hypothetical protein
VGGVAEKERNKMWRVQNKDEKREFSWRLLEIQSVKELPASQ